MRRLVWVGVGVVVTVVVIRKGRQLLEAYAPAGTAEAAAGVGRLATALAHARRDFADAVAEREAQLRHDLIGDADVDALRASRAQRTDELRQAFGRPGRHEAAPRVPADWAGPTEDPDDDGEAAFF
ncbi:hypothetical protein [Cellulomonas alba]|uniref:Secreted protein n=1 Tax=Cellulomonas alba TaxID=3053467 RepID=A0ABT7SB57_9CELL|nr:hypothetical protein [Cellulomonas alba]MDM7853421.1 hypothetical protein [Cellulomonas alba]